MVLGIVPYNATCAAWHDFQQTTRTWGGVFPFFAFVPCAPQTSSIGLKFEIYLTLIRAKEGMVDGVASHFTSLWHAYNSTPNYEVLYHYESAILERLRIWISMEKHAHVG